MNELEIALEDCLLQLSAGTSSVSQCLRRYPALAGELRPLLETALRMQHGKNMRPSGAMRDRTRARLSEHMASHPRQSSKSHHIFTTLASGLIVLALAALLVSTAFAQSAMPGQALYGWKLSTERVWRAASSDPLSVDLSLADRRTDELVRAGKDGVSEVDGVTAYNEVLTRLAAEDNSAHADIILTALHTHQKKLSEAGIHVPELDDIVSHADNSHGQGSSHKP